VYTILTFHDPGIQYEPCPKALALTSGRAWTMCLLSEHIVTSRAALAALSARVCHERPVSLTFGIGFASQERDWPMAFVLSQHRRAKHAGERDDVD